MIGRFRNRDTERFVAGQKVRQWEPFRRQAEKRLRWLEAANALGDLAVIQSNRLEKLKGDRAGQYSIRINDPLDPALKANYFEKNGNSDKKWKEEVSKSTTLNIV